MSKQQPVEYLRPAMRQAGLSVSGAALIELMRAVHAKGLPFRFRADGYSMTPFIRSGDVVTVAPLASHVPRTGDVVAFIHPGMKLLCLHRVVSARGDGFFIQGDNLIEQPDGVVSRKAILGRVTGVERAGRRITLGLGSERVVIALLSRWGGLALIQRYLGPLHARFSRSRASCGKP